MGNNLLHKKIRKISMDFDKAIEKKDIESALFYFSDDCEIELFGMILTGKNQARKWIDWIFKYFRNVKFIPITIMVSGTTFFEEFILDATLHNGSNLITKQAEVIIYKNYQIKNLSLYFDRLEIAKTLSRSFFNKIIINRLIKKSMEDLT